MKKETTKIAKYDHPEAEVIIMKMESLVCKSPSTGQNEDTEDEEVTP